MSRPRICVFCGSSPGRDPLWRESAQAFGALLAQRGIGVVYGGGGTGIMGAVADGALGCGGEVIGVIPERLVGRELAHPSVATMHVVQTMHERKARMAELAQAFVALPGGLGTFEELFEVWTWRQIGFHHKPIGALDVAGYFAPLQGLLAHAVAHGFVRPAHRELLVVEADPLRLLEKLLTAPA